MNVNDIKERCHLPSADLSGSQLAEVERLLNDHNYINTNSPARITKDLDTGIYDLEYIYPTIDDMLNDGPPTEPTGDPNTPDPAAIVLVPVDNPNDVGITSTFVNTPPTPQPAIEQDKVQDAPLAE